MSPAPPRGNESGEDYERRCGPFTKIGNRRYQTRLIDWMIRTGKKPEGLSNDEAWAMIVARKAEPTYKKQVPVFPPLPPNRTISECFGETKESIERRKQWERMMDAWKSELYNASIEWPLPMLDNPFTDHCRVCGCANPGILPEQLCEKHLAAKMRYDQRLPTVNPKLIGSTEDGRPVYTFKPPSIFCGGEVQPQDRKDEFTRSPWTHTTLRDLNEMIGRAPHGESTWYVEPSFYVHVVKRLVIAAGGNNVDFIGHPTLFGYPIKVMAELPIQSMRVERSPLLIVTKTAAGSFISYALLTPIFCKIPDCGFPTTSSDRLCDHHRKTTKEAITNMTARWDTEDRERCERKYGKSYKLKPDRGWRYYGATLAFLYLETLCYCLAPTYKFSGMIAGLVVVASACASIAMRRRKR
jgi:hypothetical protein